MNTKDLQANAFTHAGDSESFGYVDGGSGMDNFFEATSNAFPIVFIVVVILILCAFVAIAFLVVRNYKAAKAAGLNPLTAQVDLAAKVSNSQLLAPARTMEQKLGELEALRAKNMISAEEYAQARAKILGE